MSRADFTRAWIGAMRAAGAARKTPGRVPAQQPPDRIGDDYGAQLAAALSFVRPAFDELLAALPAMLDQARRERFDAGEVGRVRALIDRVRERLAERARQVDVERLARTAAARTAGYNREQLARQVRSALGVDVIATDARLPALVDAFAEANVGLIRSIPDAVATQIEAATVAAVQAGEQWSTLAADLEHRLGFPERRARLIARDQVGKLYGQINAARQRELGVTRFRWRTVRDQRVRGNPAGRYPDATPSHYARHDKIYRYDAPPNGELPGEPILCRCTAEPVFEDLLEG